MRSIIGVLLRPYWQSPNIDDLGQDAWLAAYECYRGSDGRVSYEVVRKKMVQRLERCNRDYESGGVTYYGDNDIDYNKRVNIENVANGK